MLSIDARTEAGKMALLRRIMHPKLNSAGSDAEYINKLSEWQTVAQENERISGSELDQTVKTANTDGGKRPPQMQEHLRFTLRRNWHRLQESVQAIEGLLCARRKPGNTGPDDMEVDAVVKGKGQPQR